jgi:hypothetical protein
MTVLSPRLLHASIGEHLGVIPSSVPAGKTVEHRYPGEIMTTMKALIGCTFAKVCNDIPGACIVLQMILVVMASSFLGYLFVTQELLR